MAFGPRYLRSLAFADDYTVVEPSHPREKTFRGAPPRRPRPQANTPGSEEGCPDIDPSRFFSRHSGPAGCMWPFSDPPRPRVPGISPHANQKSNRPWQNSFDEERGEAEIANIAGHACLVAANVDFGEQDISSFSGPFPRASSSHRREGSPRKPVRRKQEGSAVPCRTLRPGWRLLRVGVFPRGR